MDKKNLQTVQNISFEYKQGFLVSCWTPSTHLVVLKDDTPASPFCTSEVDKEICTKYFLEYKQGFLVSCWTPSTRLVVLKDDTPASNFLQAWDLNHAFQPSTTQWPDQKSVGKAAACNSVQNPLWALCIQSAFTPLMNSAMWGKRQLTAQCSTIYQRFVFSLHLPSDELGEESAEESEDEVHDDQSIQLLTQESFPALKSWSAMITSTNSTMVFSHTSLSDCS